ncbi:S8 family serine peptidase [Pseudoduganella sp. DS3]|uniref:S8 family serine peptidase n=1 Tax=Pseudoduganella guangdongensis TaxID=2692179 RepID=A0A6N9HJX9_9BURK|nr:S8 family serine peptidase [Pseudoduganella guangdongensis]MYN03971.1 S8 family serine peptidase [Pseudoduganella guangdongensis]
MKNSIVLSVFIASLATPAFAAGQELYAPGRILVEPRAGLALDGMSRMLQVHGGNKARKLGQSNIHIIELPRGSERAMVNKLRNNPHFKYAELDRAVPVVLTANDPYLGSEWHINKIGAPAAWDSTQGAGVTIAILDSGVDAAQPDLVANLVPGYNSYDNNTNTADICGHGTKVAGAAAAATNNGLGVAGVAGQARIMPIRIAFLNSGACYAYFSTMASGLTWAADHGAKVANISYASVPSSFAVQSAANYLRSKGGLLFVSAGNYNRDEGFTPTNSMIAVSATTSTDARASFSSYGAFVGLAAPGANIYTTVKGGGYGGVNGTSFSSPITAAVAALVMAANTTLNPDQVQNILFSTAVDLGTPGRDIYFGYGRVNAAAAVAAALALPPPDTTAPTATVASPLANSTVSGLVPVSVTAGDNVAVTRVDLKVNNTVVASDISGPFGFIWDSNGVANGMNSLVAIAYDAAGNASTSNAVAVNVANTVTRPLADTVPPVVAIANPSPGAVNGMVSIAVNASDDSGAAGISLSLYIDGQLKASGSGSTLSFNWNSRKDAPGSHTLQAVARDQAGNTASNTVQVNR